MIRLPNVVPGRSRRWMGLLAAIVAVVLVAPLLAISQAPSSASAASASDFNPGNIISDAQFYNPNAMSVTQVQAFLNSKVPTCRSGYTCLKDYRADSTYQPQRSAGCAAYPGAANQSAAEIIWKVSSVCGINPQVMLVLLEKEQGLVSSTSPTAGIYRKATGFGCPDTADCDSVYYGFFNQVYNAAYQYKKYQATPGGRNFQAGRVNTIQWSPDAACGSSQVYIENQATAGLYIYTPYRPNGAALANMYGTGDGCSTYGNRNFFRMFTDWFGTTQGGGDFARTESNSTIYLLSGTTKYAVPSMEVLNGLGSLGPYRIVSQSYLDSFSTSPLLASTLVRDPANGDVSLVEGGVRHGFSSCDLVSTYGFACGSAINLAPAQLAKLPTGAKISPFFLVSGGTVYMLTPGGRVAIPDWASVVSLNGGTVPFIATMNAQAAAALPIVKVVLDQMSLVKSPNSATVFFIDGSDRKLPIASFGVASEFGATGFKTVPQFVLDAYSTGSVLTQTVRCDGKDYFAAEGALRELALGAATSGLPVTDLSAASCSLLPRGQTIAGALFVMSPENSSVYGIKAGTARAVPSWTTLLALNDGSAPQIVAISQGARTAIPVQPPYLPGASLVRSPGNATIYFVDGAARTIPVGSFATTSAFGINSWSYVTDASLATYTANAASLSRVVTCNATQYFASGGRIYPLAGGVAHGMPVTELTGGTCAVLPQGGGTSIEHIFVKTTDNGTVYTVEAGTRRPVGTWDQIMSITGGKQPVILVDAAGSLADIPVGPAF
ncbi:hypothetical protein [Cryobacterium sp. W22_MBD10_FK3]|uniref:hypothetical protein n=1 Tax=Cryobacterium sp. W22_MBD10_FK3 TaxID=3240273 RepID=UPI003F8F27B4